MRRSGALVAAVVVLGLSRPVLPNAEAQAPLRIGASLSQTGPYTPLALKQLRGYQLCVKHVNEKGGLLGRRVELLVEDDRSEPALAARIYQKLVTQDKVDAILGPYSSPLTEAVADLAEKHRMAMVAPGAATTSIFKKGRKFIFMVYSPAAIYLEGLLDMAARRGLRTVAVIHEDTIFPKAIAQGTVELAKKRGLQTVLFEGYPKGTTDFTTVLGKVAGANPDVLAAATYFDDAVGISRQLRKANVNPRMFGVTAGGDLPTFHEILGRDAEFVYGATQWTPEIVTLIRGGQLVPVTRRYPGAKEFVDAHRKEFSGADLSYHTAGGYSGCQVLIEAIRQSGSLDGGRLRTAILTMDTNIVYGTFKVDPDGVQIGHKMLVFQWQDGKKVIVWPDELSPAAPRFPTPPWSQR
ncbi:MAG: amino acid ABC transporter substrate-binding protein [Candidatus Rokubacteria bacterium]|nr:amino acid ABC transporter substrate-binding protein [Candidatus Rokubacteria bacterium]